MLCRVVCLGAVLACVPVALRAGGGGEDAAASEAGTLAVGSRVRITSPGAMIGGAIGALSGILINIGDYNSDNNTLVVSIVGAASCAAVGALVGWGIKSDIWRPAQAKTVSAAIVPVPRGASFSVRVAWGQSSR